jgi:hypothetical protein
MGEKTHHVVIPPHHQSAPKEHWADREIKKAAREIDEGQWSPEPDAEMDEAMAGMRIALGAGTSGVAIGKKATEEEFTNTEMLNLIGRHPRVVEALEKMKLEVYEPADPHAALERTLAMRELAEASTKPQKWDRQGRWEGDDNEEMRYGKILTPEQFYDRLGKVIGKGRLKLGEHVIRTSTTAKSGRIGLYVRNPEWKGEKAVFDDRPLKINRLRLDGEKLLRSAKALRRLGSNSEADKKVNLAGEMAQEAMRLQMDISVEDQTRPAEFLRVATLQWPAMTEWMIMGFTQYGAVYQAKFLGWRTALLTMIRSKVITEKEAHKAFPVPSGPAAQWYLEQLAMMRNDEGTVQ